MTIKHILMTQHNRERLANTIDRGEAEEIFLGDKSGPPVSCPMLEAGYTCGALLHVAGSDYIACTFGQFMVYFGYGKNRRNLEKKEPSRWQVNLRKRQILGA